MLGKARPPRSADVVVTSREILEQRLPVTRVIRWNDGDWMYLSGHEGDDSGPIATHFEHVVDVDVDVLHLRLHTGRFALRASPSADWSVWGPLADDAIDELMTSGQIADLHNRLSAGTTPDHGRRAPG